MQSKNNWHEVHPAGNFHYIKGSPLIATAVESPIILCLRSTRLTDRSQNIRQTIKDACRNQFKKYIPGVLHIHVNTRLYGIGDRALLESIIADLSKDASFAMNEYSRVSAILFDIVTPPLGNFVLQHRRLTVVSENPKAKNFPLPLIPGICLL
ncbi:MAG: hypothetical protein HY742_11370 [Deltaproteobacteria bacterium]|nr:hypothetical protein [Deltaproteobacteria bacterium]